MQPDKSDRPLILAWDEARIAQLVARHQRALAAWLASLGCAAANSDDLVQETFLTLLAVPFEERSPGATSTFLRRIARNLFLKSLRRGRREIPDPDVVDAAWSTLEGDDGGDAYVAALRLCLAGLSEDGRTALRLRYQEGLAPRAIAVRLRLSLGGAKSVLLRAKARLRACIRRRVAP